jgi:hypothetical protein
LGLVTERLVAMGCKKQVLDAWKNLVKKTVERDRLEEGY